MNPNAPAWCEEAGKPKKVLQAAARDFLPTKEVAKRKNVVLLASARDFVPANSSLGRGTLCRFFLRGACRKGLSCPFVHDATKAYGDSSLAKDEVSPISSSYHLDDGIKCVFGPGAAIVKLELGDVGSRPSTTVLISGLPIVSEYDIESRLSPFGSLLWLRVDSSNNTNLFAMASFSEPASAMATAANLHGSQAMSWIGVTSNAQKKNATSKTATGAVSVVVKENGLSVNSNSGVSVKVQWYAPSRCAWIHFARAD
jgi:hypothetical protein